MDTSESWQTVCLIFGRVAGMAKDSLRSFNPNNNQYLCTHLQQKSFISISGKNNFDVSEKVLSNNKKNI